MSCGGVSTSFGWGESTLKASSSSLPPSATQIYPVPMGRVLSGCACEGRPWSLGERGYITGTPARP